MHVLAYAARRQWQVFTAALYRETINRFGRRSMGVIEEIGSIAVHILVFSAMRILFGVEQQNGMPILPFISVGVFDFWIFRTGISQMSSALAVAKSYEVFQKVTPLDVAMARGALNILVYIGLAVSTFGLLELFGYSEAVGDWSGVVLILVANGLFGIGCGLVLAGLFHYLPIMRTVVMTGAMRFLSLIDGTFFVFPDLPPTLRTYAVWIPNLQLNDMARQAYFPSYRENWTSLTYVSAWTAGSLLAGLLVERALRNAIAAKRAA